MKEANFERYEEVCEDLDTAKERAVEMFHEQLDDLIHISGISDMPFTLTLEASTQIERLEGDMRRMTLTLNSARHPSFKQDPRKK